MLVAVGVTIGGKWHARARKKIGVRICIGGAMLLGLWDGMTVMAK